MSEKDQSNTEDLTSPNKLRQFLKEWWELIASISTAFTAILATVIKTEGIAKLVGFVVAAALIGVSFYLFHRIQKQRQLRSQRRERLAFWETQKQKKTAFRGLYCYVEGDILPGEDRQREARTIFTQLSDSNYSFGVICGDIGCGKTSLLRCALQRLLKESGFNVLYIASPTNISNKGSATKPVGKLIKLRHDLQELEMMVKKVSDESPLVLIIDQFEELFIEYNSPSQRSDIGRLLNKLIHLDRHVKILCAIRRDYLADMQDLAPQLRDPISSRTLFQIKNLTEKQASRIIEQCAQLDGLELSKDFAATLAADLADGGFVRPPELQIVCTALASDLTLSKYRLSGGAKGILSSHIENAILTCTNPDAGRKILRALCDFAAQAKKDPQTIDAIREAIVPIPHPRNLDESQVISIILKQFEAARIVVSGQHSTENIQYSLVHDYLIDAVSSSTSDASTRTEEANQLLHYYLAGLRSGSRTRIPYLKRRFIKKNADPKLIDTQQSRQLFKTSRWIEIYALAGVLIVILLTTAILAAIATTKHIWKGQEIGRQWSIRVPTDYKIFGFPEKGLIVTSYTDGKQHVHVWDSKTAKSLINIDCRDTVLGPEGNFLLVADDGNLTTYAIHLPTNTRYPLPLRPNISSKPEFGPSGRVITYIDQVGSDNKPAFVLKVWSITEQRELGVIEDFSLPAIQLRQLTKGADRLVMLCSKGQTIVPVLWNVQSGQVLGDLVQNESSSCSTFAISEERSWAATLEVMADGQISIALWDLSTGRLIRSRTLSEHFKQLLGSLSSRVLGSMVMDTDIYFAANGEYIILDQTSGNPLGVFHSPDLLQATDIPNSDLQWVDSQEELRYMMWRVNPSDTMVWDITQAKPRLIQGLELSNPEGNNKDKITDDNVFVHRDHEHAVIIKPTGRAELWNLIQGKKIKDLETVGKVVSCGFTLDENVVCLRLEGGIIMAYDVSTGIKLGDIVNSGGDNSFAIYNPSCHKFIVWTSEGRILKFTEGSETLGLWFRPTSYCHED
jgi:NACHT domain.